VVASRWLERLTERMYLSIYLEEVRGWYPVKIWSEKIGGIENSKCKYL
jgi:hypothetical protein